jgi:GT2 family glycosyltransferase
VVIPTLGEDACLRDCVESLERQTCRDLEVIVSDNSGRGLVRRNGFAPRARILENARNLGFGAAINEAVQASRSTFVATLNDDAVAHPRWLEAMLAAIERRPDVGMCASQVRLYGEERLDSVGMLVCGDGSSKQRGHLKPPEDFPVTEETLFPSGSAALFRRSMWEALGGFDSRFFLYCEDTDLGLRARWAGWKCLYVPDAVVEHHYSRTAGRASRLKAFYVERNRLFVMAKNFPAPMLLAAPWVTFQRYFWHAWYILRGRGSAARFRADGNSGIRMLWYVVRAHVALAAQAGRLWRERRAIRTHARITPAIFRHLVRSHSISARKVAAL